MTWLVVITAPKNTPQKVKIPKHCHLSGDSVETAGSWGNHYIHLLKGLLVFCPKNVLWVFQRKCTSEKRGYVPWPFYMCLPHKTMVSTKPFINLSSVTCSNSGSTSLGFPLHDVVGGVENMGQIIFLNSLVVDCNLLPPRSWQLYRVLVVHQCNLTTIGHWLAFKNPWVFTTKKQQSPMA